MSQRFEHHARTVTVLTFFSRVTGLARDAALARVFGVSAVTDAFWFAFLIPNLFRRLFGEGALSAAFLPVYSQLDRDDPATARRLATLTVALMVMALGGLTLVIELVLFAISLWIEGRDGGGGASSLAVRLMMIMLPYMPLVCIVAIVGAMLQVHGRFGPTASAPVVLNLFIVGATVGFVAIDQQKHVALVSGAVLLAGAVQVVWAVWALRRSARGSVFVVGGRTSTNHEQRTMNNPWPHMHRVLRLALPMFLGLGVLQLNTFIDGVIASYPSTVGPTIFGYDFPLAQGANTALNNAQRLYEFPLGVFGIAIATAIFPALARVARTTDNTGAFTDILRRGLRLVMYIGLPASVGLMLVRVPLTAAILQGRNFTSEDTQRVAFVLMGYAPAIWAYSMTHVLTRAFYARGDALTPVKVAVSMVGLNLALNLTLIWTPLKEAGLAWSTATCAIVQVMILLRLTCCYAAHVVDGSVIGSWLRSALATAVMGVIVWTIARWILPPHDPTWGWAVLELTLLVPAGIASVAVMSVLLKMPEMWWVMGKATTTRVSAE